MNNIKIQQNALKVMAKDPQQVRALQYDGSLWITYDGFALYRVDPCYLTLSNPGPGDLYFQPLSSAMPAKDTWERRQAGKKLLARYATQKAEAWVDLALLKPFDAGFTVAITGPKSPVFVREEDRLMGMVMPCKVPSDAQQDN